MIAQAQAARPTGEPWTAAVFVPDLHRPWLTRAITRGDPAEPQPLWDPDQAEDAPDFTPWLRWLPGSPPDAEATETLHRRVLEHCALLLTGTGDRAPVALHLRSLSWGRVPEGRRMLLRWHAPEVLTSLCIAIESRAPASRVGLRRQCLGPVHSIWIPDRVSRRVWRLEAEAGRVRVRGLSERL